MLSINALFCMAWVMVHHIPDLEADKRAVPMKRTSVVWFVDTFGLYYARFPAFIYLLTALFCGLWLGFDRFWAACFLSSNYRYCRILCYENGCLKLRASHCL